MKRGKIKTKHFRHSTTLMQSVFLFSPAFHLFVYQLRRQPRSQGLSFLGREEERH